MAASVNHNQIAQPDLSATPKRAFANVQPMTSVSPHLAMTINATLSNSVSHAHLAWAIRTALKTRSVMPTTPVAAAASQQRAAVQPFTVISISIVTAPPRPVSLAAKTPATASLVRFVSADNALMATAPRVLSAQTQTHPTAIMVRPAR